MLTHDTVIHLVSFIFKISCEKIEISVLSETWKHINSFRKFFPTVFYDINNHKASDEIYISSFLRDPCNTKTRFFFMEVFSPRSISKTTNSYVVNTDQITLLQSLQHSNFSVAELLIVVKHYPRSFDKNDSSNRC